MLSNTTIYTNPELTSSEVLKSTDQTVEAVQNAVADCPVIVDFDETLFLRNSTEEYLRSIYPRTLGAGFILTASFFKPWRWLFPPQLRAHDVSKDWFLVVVATLLFPWTVLVWQQRAKKLAQQYCNIPLAKAIDGNTSEQLVVATLGFNWIVRPLLRHLPIEKVRSKQYKLVGCRFWQGASDRARGKLAMVSAKIGAAAVSKSVVVTDAAKDMPILRASATPCLLTWPDALFSSAVSDVYFPLFSSAKARDISPLHIAKQVIFAHWLFLVLASSIVSARPMLHAFSLLLLTISYWCVHEIGYPSQKKWDTLWPWLWATSLAIPACFLLTTIQLAPSAAALSISPLSWRSILGQSSDGFWQAVAVSSALWLFFLGTVRLTVALYNRFNEAARMWVYPFVQTHKMFGFALLIQISEVGALLLMALIISQWLEYCIYQCGGDRKSFPTSVSTLLVFTLLFAGAAVSSPQPEALMNWQTTVIFGFCLVRSFRKLRQVLAKLDLVVNSRRNRTIKAPTSQAKTETRH